MKIAVVTEDEKTICQHFGRAPLYVVFTAEDGKITGKETREKFGHNHIMAQGGHGPHEHHSHGGQGGQHGFDTASQNVHATMADAIKDCEVMITGGMGMGAYYSLKQYNIEPYISDVPDIEQAVKLFLDGKLTNLTERLH